MNVKTEDLGKNSYKLTVEVDADVFAKAYEQSYQKNKNLHHRLLNKHNQPLQNSLHHSHVLSSP